MFYPTGGFRRATRYVIHRMRRLPDRPHRIARGVFAGCLIGFLPLPGLQFLGAAGLAWIMRGNILAALLGTFNSNPITTPFFAVGSISLGHWMLGIDTPLNAEAIGDAFARAGGDLWHNFIALFGPEQMHWGGLVQFWSEVYAPYFIGALGPGILLSLLFYYLTIPLVEAYQKARVAKFKERSEKRLLLREKLAALKVLADGRQDPVPDIKQGDDEPPPAT
ncbi:MAG: DUF2062 domain-containing protein [Paracoccaceae bacterium]